MFIRVQIYKSFSIHIQCHSEIGTYLLIKYVSRTRETGLLWKNLNKKMENKSNQKSKIKMISLSNFVNL